MANDKTLFEVIENERKAVKKYKPELLEMPEFVDSNFISDRVTKAIPSLKEEGQQATQSPTINYTPDAQNALERAKALQQKK